MAVRRRSSRSAPGQHFLRSSRLSAGIVADAGVAPGDFVIDVGAGSGVFTNALLDAGVDVLAIELDHELASRLRRTFERRGVRVVEDDARRRSWPRESFSVVSNR